MKAGAFKVLSALPHGETAYGLIQDHFTHTTSVTDDKVEQRIGFGLDCLQAIRDFLGVDELSRLHCVDVGAGWQPTVPLLLYSAGCERQTLFDISRYLRVERLSELVDCFRRLAPGTGAADWCHRLPPAVEPTDSLESYLAKLGVRYVAPYRLADLERERGCHVVTCTSVLHHLREDVLRPLLRAIATALSPGGLLAAHTPLHDPYALFDKSITPYNKWRYSEFVWERLVNSRLMSFNRLTASDYRRIVEESGFEIVRFETPEPTPEEIEAFRRAKVHPAFASLSVDELGANSFFLVARRPEQQ